MVQWRKPNCIRCNWRDNSGTGLEGTSVDWMEKVWFWVSMKKNCLQKIVFCKQLLSINIMLVVIMFCVMLRVFSNMNRWFSKWKLPSNFVGVVSMDYEPKVDLSSPHRISTHRSQWPNEVVRGWMTAASVCWKCPDGTTVCPLLPPPLGRNGSVRVCGARFLRKLNFIDKIILFKFSFFEKDAYSVQFCVMLKN